MALFPRTLSQGHEALASSSSTSQYSIQSSTARPVHSIVYSCVFTVIACLWICARPNVPAPNHSRLRIFRSKLNIFFWIIIAPDLVVYWAFRQYVEARAIARSYKEDGWTKTHGHFMVMGGFILYVDGSPYQTLSIQKFNALLEEGAIDFPNITEPEIHDRGQQSTFLTAVVMLQAAWFIIQCSPRFGRDLFVIHLECLALVLLIANAMLYILWWDKPLDIRYPVRVDLKQAVHNLDVMGEGRVSAFKREERIQKEIFRSVLEPPPSTGAKTRSRFSRFLWFLLRTFVIWPLRSIGRDIFFIQFGFKGRSPAIPIGALSVPLFYYPEVTNVPLHLSIAVASILGGALNSANFVLFTQMFPSPQAQLAWKIGTFLSVGASVMAAVLHALLHAARYLHIHTDSPKYVKVLGYMLAGIAVFLFFLGHMAYIAGRFILIVDAFLCLKGLPESAVIVLPWTTYIPHLS